MTSSSLLSEIFTTSTLCILPTDNSSSNSSNSSSNNINNTKVKNRVTKGNKESKTNSDNDDDNDDNDDKEDLTQQQHQHQTVVLKSTSSSITPATTTTTTTNDNNTTRTTNTNTPSVRRSAAAVHSGGGSSSNTTTSYFRDSTSGRSKLLLPIVIQTHDIEARDALLESGAIVPSPWDNPYYNDKEEDEDEESDDDDGEEEEGEEDGNESSSSSSTKDTKTTTTKSKKEGSEEEEENERKAEIRFECLCLTSNSTTNSSTGSNHSNSTTTTTHGGATTADTTNPVVVVEGVTVLSTSILGGTTADGEDTGDDEHDGGGVVVVGIRFDVEVTLRSLFSSTSRTNNTHNSSGSSSSCNNNTYQSSSRNTNNNHQQQQLDTTNLKLEIRSILEVTHIRSKEERDQNFQRIMKGGGNFTADDGDRAFDDSILAMQSLDIGTSGGGGYEYDGLLFDDDDDVVGDGDDDDRYGGRTPISSSYLSETLTYVLPPPQTSTTSPPPPIIATTLPSVDITVVPALTLDVHEISSPSSTRGVTLVSLVISHSNLHDEDVTVTSVALHPGHSRPVERQKGRRRGQQQQQHQRKAIEQVVPPTPTRSNRRAPSANNNNNNNTSEWKQSSQQQEQQKLLSLVEDGKAIPGGEQSVINMTRHLRWEYTPGTAPSLPLVLKPWEAHATVIRICANDIDNDYDDEDGCGGDGGWNSDGGNGEDDRDWVSPICVRAIVGDDETGGSGDGGRKAPSSSFVGADVVRDVRGRGKSMVTVSADARWTTARGVSHSVVEEETVDGEVGEMRVDAFRVDLLVMETSGTSGDGCETKDGGGTGGKSYCRVGELVRLSLRVMNLSNGTRDLMLMMAKEEEEEEEETARMMPVKEEMGHQRSHSAPISPSGYTPHPSLATSKDFAYLGGRSKTTGTLSPLTRPSSPMSTIPSITTEVINPLPHQPSLPSPTYITTNHVQQHHPPPTNNDLYYKNRRSINTPVVSEVNGYTFGVLGLDGDDDGTVRYSRDHELLAVDTALLLGEVKGQNSIEAELRFVPLREGTLDVPNLRLYDNCTMRWYICKHALQIVSVNGGGGGGSDGDSDSVGDIGGESKR